MRLLEKISVWLHWTHSEHLTKHQTAGAVCWTWTSWRRGRLCLTHRRTPSTACLVTGIQHWLLRITARNSSTKSLLRIAPLIPTLLYPGSGFGPSSITSMHTNSYIQARSGFRPWAPRYPSTFTTIDEWLRTTGEQQLWSFYSASISSPWTKAASTEFFRVQLKLRLTMKFNLRVRLGSIRFSTQKS